MVDRFSSNDCLLIPCTKGYEKNSSEFKHSIVGQICIDNKPLKVQTILSIGSVSKLRTYLKSRTGLDVLADDDLRATFNGVSGLTFPCTDEDGAGYVVIWMPKFDWSISDFETLDHETLHASVMVMWMSGVRSKIFSARKEVDIDDEGLAYRKSSMFATLLKELAKRQHSMFRKSVSSNAV